MKNHHLRHFALFGLLALASAGAAKADITIDGKDKGRTVEEIETDLAD